VKQTSPNAGFKWPLGREGCTMWRGEGRTERKERGRERYEMEEWP